MKNKSYLNLIIDITLLLLLAAISGISFLMKFIMPSGHAIRDKGAQAYASQVWGMGRHDWGDIHWILGLLFLLFLVLHILLHWGMILSIFNRMIPNKTGRVIVYAAIIIIISILLIGPFLYLF